ncbi:MAG: tRNA (N(6)-L-threonylcarbamoyladenosine(37)-C(2))-methylthiotransferase MtaB [Calditrichales bacterium]|nr:MAG: tRNA (N(6)-L-threonylcarbamoyladenosine(37)-C(2))-methylthiotransferase MtaB [Calditrichales bacterium]
MYGKVFLLKVSFYTLGCRLNQAETAIIAKSFQSRGYELAEFGQAADMTVINTCTVTEQADSKCRQVVRNILRNSPDTYVAVVGCYAQMAVDTIREIPGVDMIMGNEHKLKIADYINGLEKQDTPIVIHSPKISRDEFTIESYGLYDNSTRANLKIQDGCNFVCGFCIIPTARGPARSRKLDDILEEAQTLVGLGHQELVLTGVNIGTYASEGNSVMTILDELEKIDDLKRIRISSIEPTTIASEIVERMADSEKLCKHLHIPLQSGDDQILKLMRRKYDTREFASFIEYVEKTVPGVGIGTDVMVGFPSEDTEAFINTKKFMADLPIVYYHVFTYSDRQGTTSFRMKEKVPHEEKKKRTRILIDQGTRKKQAFFDRYIGRESSVLFESQNKDGMWTGYMSNYINVAVASNEDLHNRIRKVRLTGFANGRMTAELTDPE